MKILAMIFLVALLAACSGPSPGEVTGEYDTRQLSVDFSWDEAYEIGANTSGLPVFKNPKKALKQAKIDFEAGFEATAAEFDLEAVSHDNYQDYKTYGWQITTTDEKIQKQGVHISKFFDIYENSYE